MKALPKQAQEFLQRKAEKVLVLRIKGDKVISTAEELYRYENKSQRPGTQIMHLDGTIETLNVYQVKVENRIYLYEEYLFLVQSGLFYLGLRCATNRPEEDNLPQEINWNWEI